MLDPFEPENKQKTKKKQRNRRKYPDSSELSRLEGGGVFVGMITCPVCE